MPANPYTSNPVHMSEIDGLLGRSKYGSIASGYQGGMFFHTQSSAKERGNKSRFLVLILLLCSVGLIAGIAFLISRHQRTFVDSKTSSFAIGGSDGSYRVAANVGTLNKDLSSSIQQPTNLTEGFESEWTSEVSTMKKEAAKMYEDAMKEAKKHSDSILLAAAEDVAVLMDNAESVSNKIMDETENIANSVQARTEDLTDEVEQ